jgi:hypothetical protein
MTKEQIISRCINCGGTKKEHGVKKPYRCPTKLEESYWNPWTAEAYEAAEEAGKAATGTQVPMDEYDCERPGECLTCGTQCDEEGICPLCAALERAQEQVREATEAAFRAAELRGRVPADKQKALRAARAALNKAMAAPVESCRKCGKALTLHDVTHGGGCTDEGDGEEKGRVFVYCSEHCRETH